MGTVQAHVTAQDHLTARCRKQLPRFRNYALVLLRTVPADVRRALEDQGLINGDFSDQHIQANPCAAGYVADPSTFETCVEGYRNNPPMAARTIDTSPSKAPDFESRHMDNVAIGERLYAAGRPMSECECSDQEYGWEGAADDADDRRLEEFDRRLCERIARSRA